MSRVGWVGYIFCTVLFGALIWLGGISTGKAGTLIATLELHMLGVLALCWPINVTLYAAFYPPRPLEELSYLLGNRKQPKRWGEKNLMMMGVLGVLGSLLYCLYLVYRAMM